MFILPPPKQVSWADRTMTVLRRNRMQACERELTGLPQHSLFDASVTDVEAEVFFAGSWYAKEEKQPALLWNSWLNLGLVPPTFTEVAQSLAPTALAT